MRCLRKESNPLKLAKSWRRVGNSLRFFFFHSFFFSFLKQKQSSSWRSHFLLTGWEAHVQRTSEQEVNVQVIFIPFHVVLLIPQIGFQRSFTVSVLQSKPSFNVGILKKKLQSKHVCFTSARCDVQGNGPQCGSQLCCKIGCVGAAWITGPRVGAGGATGEMITWALSSCSN